MRIVNKDEFKLQMKKFAEQILRGAIFIHPTDTIYGLGCDATNKEAVRKLRDLKDKKTSPLSVIVPSKEWILENCEAKKEDLKDLPGPYTLIFTVKDKKCVSSNVSFQKNNLGVRIPNHWFSEVVKILDIPIITTAANISGGRYMKSVDDMHPDLKKGVDFIIDDGIIKGHHSTIVHLEKEEE